MPSPLENVISQAMQSMNYMFFKAKSSQTPEEVLRCATFNPPTGGMGTTVLQDGRIRRKKVQILEICEEKIMEFSETSDMEMLMRCINSARAWASSSVSKKLSDKYVALQEKHHQAFMEKSNGTARPNPADLSARIQRDRQEMLTKKAANT